MAPFCLSGKAGKPSSLKDDCVTPTEGRQSEWQGRHWLTVGSEGSHKK
jgi:hypothetical protein